MPLGSLACLLSRVGPLSHHVLSPKALPYPTELEKVAPKEEESKVTEFGNYGNWDSNQDSLIPASCTVPPPGGWGCLEAAWGEHLSNLVFSISVPGQILPGPGAQPALGSLWGAAGFCQEPMVQASAPALSGPPGSYAHSFQNLYWAPLHQELRGIGVLKRNPALSEPTF